MLVHIADECDEYEYRAILIELANGILDEVADLIDIIDVLFLQIVEVLHRDMVLLVMLIYVELDDDEHINVTQLEYDEIDCLC